MSRTDPRALENSQQSSSSVSNCLQGARAFVQGACDEVAQDVRDCRDSLRSVATAVGGAVRRPQRQRAVESTTIVHSERERAVESTTIVHGARAPGSWGLLNPNADLRVSVFFPYSSTGSLFKFSSLPFSFRAHFNYTAPHRL